MSDKWKYVSVGKCVGAIIWSIVALATIFIPFSFGGSSGTVLAYSKLPIVGDSSIFANIIDSFMGLTASFNLPTAISNIVMNISGYAVYAFLIISVVTIAFGLLLAIIRTNVLRIIFKIFSIFFGIILIISGLCFILYIPGAIMSYMQSTTDVLANIGKAFMETGVVYALGTAIFCFILGGKQFKFFSKPY